MPKKLRKTYPQESSAYIFPRRSSNLARRRLYRERIQSRSFVSIRTLYREELAIVSYSLHCTWDFLCLYLQYCICRMNATHGVFKGYGGESRKKSNPEEIQSPCKRWSRMATQQSACVCHHRSFYSDSHPVKLNSVLRLSS